MVRADAQGTEKRVALIIGVGKYQNASELTNPPNDARLVAPLLEKLGFETEIAIDPDYEAMKRAIRNFGRRLEGARVALFYYAGHGLQVAGRNYLLPVEVALAREQDLRYEAFDVQAILDEMDAPGRVNLIFLDACRDNPLARSLAGHLGQRSAAVGQGLAQVETTVSGTLIAYATDPGKVALDGTGSNSPFTEALARHIATPALDVRQMLTRVRADVQKATNGHQRPWVNESLDADFYFVPQAAQPPPPEPDAVGAPPKLRSSPPSPFSNTSPEIVFWQSIANSDNRADFEAYLREFPQGTFAPLARNRLALLVAPPRPAVPPPDDDSAWSGADRQAVQTALVTLGHFTGRVDGEFSADTRAAILRWQGFDALEETGHLTIAQRDRLVAEATQVLALLKVGASSPRGTWASSIRDSKSQFNLGAAFERGEGRPKDAAEAAYWYALAAAQSWPAAYTNLGTLWVRGDGMPKADPEAAARLWAVAAALGDGTAMFDLGVMYKKGVGRSADLVVAKRWYARGAERKHQASAAALRRLGG